MGLQGSAGFDFSYRQSAEDGTFDFLLVDACRVHLSSETWRSCWDEKEKHRARDLTLSE